MGHPLVEPYALVRIWRGKNVLYGIDVFALDYDVLHCAGHIEVFKERHVIWLHHPSLRLGFGFSNGVAQWAGGRLVVAD